MPAQSSLLSEASSARSSSARSSLIVDVVCGLAIAALFSGLNRNIGPVKVQLSDVLALGSILLIVVRGFSTPRVSAPVGLALLVYLCVYLLSGLTVGLTSGIKELIQALLAFGFVFALFGYYQNRPTNRLFAVSLLLILTILAYNIGWHVLQERYVGWKQLNEPKTIFILLPLLLMLMAQRLDRRWRMLVIAAGVLAALIIFLSGERKAYLFGVASLLICGGPAVWRYGALALIAAPVFWLAASMDQGGYLGRQVESVSRRFSTQQSEEASIAHLIDERRPATVSDAQREITTRLAKELWRERPILGIGTNGFSPVMDRQTGIPRDFRADIHGEFHRALFENGIVGLFLYAAFWVTAFVRILLERLALRSSEHLRLFKTKLMCATMFLIYCSFEASKGLTVLCIVSLPFIVALAPRTIATAGAAARRSVRRAPRFPVHA